MASRPLIALITCLFSMPLAADLLDNVGYTRLQTELGERMPAGRGLTIGQVEAPLQVDHDRDPRTSKVTTWWPDVGHRDLRTSKLIDRSNAPPGAFSGHATAVARHLVGEQHGMARAVDALEVFSVADWFGNRLRIAAATPPIAAASRVVNHSWASSLDQRGRAALDGRVLRRVDWLAERDELISVAGIRNAAKATNAPLLASAYNVLVVGRSDGWHSRGTARVDDVYVAGRTRPHLVAPAKTASIAAPLVAGAVALLVETAADPLLSTCATAITTRSGLSVYDAGRAETLRAILMATADRRTDNTSYANISNYRARATDRTVNGLDRRFGAGQLNIHSAWRLLQAGEQEGGRGSTVAASGFDFVAGTGTAAAARSYAFSVGDAFCAATLSWHLQFPGTGASRFDASVSLPDLDLHLYSADGDLVAVSESRSETTENIYQRLDAGSYRFEVRPAGPAQPPVDYALAWRCRSSERGDDSGVDD